MSHLGFEKFAVVGHDRGGRVGHRMALDQPHRITKLAVLDIVPTYKLLHSLNNEVATAFYHWFFLVEPAPFPETLIANNLSSTSSYLKYMMFRDMSHSEIPTWMGGDAFSEYLRCFRNPATIHASCEDYRASVLVDLKHDEDDLDHKVNCPVLALWRGHGALHRTFDVLATWRARTTNVSGRPLSGRHFLPEEVSDETFVELRGFLSA